MSLLLLLLLATVPHSFSQPPLPRVKLPPATSDAPSAMPQHDPDDSAQLGSRDEMLRNLEVRRREAVYKENLERARESAQLGTEIRDAYRKQRSLGQAELKKLGRIEKLAKSIRNDNGGDDDEKALEDPPKDLTDAVSRLVELSEDLKERVEKTPKHVVSTAVISSANQMLELIRLIRNIGG